MVALIKPELAEITSREVSRYSGTMPGALMYPILDDQHQRYGVVIIPEDEKDRPAYMAVLARVIEDFIVIDEDGSYDKPLYQALMVNGGVPREQIILAYKGETLPDQVTG